MADAHTKKLFMKQQEALKNGDTKTYNAITIKMGEHNLRKSKKGKAEFKIGDKFDTHGHTNMSGIITVREIEKRKVFFTDSDRKDYQGFDKSTARRLIEAGEWTKITDGHSKTTASHDRKGSINLTTMIFVVAALIIIPLAGLDLIVASGNSTTG